MPDLCVGKSCKSLWRFVGWWEREVMGLWQGWEPRVEEGRLGRRPPVTSHSYNLISPLSCLTIRSIYRNCNALKTIFKRNIRFLVVFKTKKIVPHHQRRWSKLTTVKKLSSETTLARLTLCDPNPKSELWCLDWRRRRKCWDRSSEDEKQTNLYIGKPSQSHPFS